VLDWLLPIAPERIAAPVRPPAVSRVHGALPDIANPDSDAAVSKFSVVSPRKPPHTPPAQKLPSPHAVQSGRGVDTQAPVAGLQLFSAQPPLVSVQTTGDPPHTPAVQMSVVVQRFPSLQRVPLVRGVCSHRPVEGLHADTLHWSEPVQVTPRQRSPVQRLGCPVHV
jgi:hypothetical protein